MLGWGSHRFACAGTRAGRKDNYKDDFLAHHIRTILDLGTPRRTMGGKSNE